MNTNLDRLAREIGNSIEEELLNCGIFFRLFYRAKTEDSITNKLKLKNYANSVDNKLMQDCIGVRITTYFDDDLEIIYNILKEKRSFISETRDEKKISVFEPERINLIFRLNEDHSKELNDLIIQNFTYVDTTYEIQLRTVLSEGWHEVEHDLRYKCKSDWDKYPDISHIFNGIYASLVTSDWSILSIFENLSYKHFKSKNWSALMRNKFRLRFGQENLNDNIIEIIDSDNDLAKELFKIDRNEFIQKFINKKIRIPITLNNIFFVLNAFYLKRENIKKITPEFILLNKKIYPI